MDENEQRADRAAQVLRLYAGITGEQDEFPQVLVTDLLTDLMHYSDQEHLPFWKECLYMAEIHHDAEVA
jgi:hypothetical protein